jgi:hypothetical protein
VKTPRTNEVWKLCVELDARAPLRDLCADLEVENNELRNVIVELTAAGNCLRHDKDLCASVIRNAGGHAHVQWSTDNWNRAKDWDRRKNGTI